MQQHAPERTVFGKLEEIQKILDQASPEYRIVAKSTGELSVSPKSPETPPIIVPIKFSFPDTPEGKEAQAQFENHLPAKITISVNWKSHNFNRICNRSYKPERETRIGSVSIPVRCLHGRNTTY